jgi:predicted AAA+ superfamily ATPase
MSVSKDILKSVIISQSEQKNRVRLIERDKQKEIEEAIETPFIQIVSGIRRCGKSTIIKQIRQHRKSCNYAINFDDNRLYNFKTEDFEKLNEAFLELFGDENTYYFDEIQSIKGWEKYVSRLFNEGKKIFITGSNALMLSKEMGTYLTGRNIRTELYPFSFNEFIKWEKTEIREKDFLIPAKSAKIKNLFSKYLKTGGFPEFIQTENRNFLKSLYDDIIYRDIIARYKIKNEKALVELLHYLISNISKEVSYNALKNILGLSNTITVKDYINYFEQSYLLFTVNKFDYSLKKQLVNPKKIYVIDTGLANSISFQFSENLGRQLENIVFLQLKRLGFEIFYHKDKYECDFIIRERNQIVNAIQVSKTLFDKNTREREVRGLVEAMRSYNLKKSIILTFEEKETIFTEGFTIEVIPVYQWILQQS